MLAYNVGRSVPLRSVMVCLNRSFSSDLGGWTPVGEGVAEPALLITTEALPVDFLVDTEAAFAG